MTTEEAKQILPIIQAFAEGKTIEFYVEGKDEWQAMNEPSFDLDADLYRIKPELKYRPFKTQEECWNEMHKHPDFGWLKSKATGSLAIIGSVLKRKDEKPLIIWATNEGFEFLASDVFNDYTFTDGAPFGIKEE